MEAAGMNVAKDSAAFKSIQEIAERAEVLKQFVVQAATDIRQGRIERSICGRSTRGLAYPRPSVHS
jgi:hypothetical protein